MTTLTNTFDAGTAAATVTTGNSGGASGSAFDSAVVGTSSTLTYVGSGQAHGAAGCQIVVGASAAAATYVAWSTSLTAAATLTTLYTRVYLQYAVLPSMELPVIRGMSATTQRWRAAVTTGGKLVLRDGANGLLATSTTTLAAGTVWRIEVSAGGGTSGAITCRIYAGDAATVTETLTPASPNLGGPVAEIRYGVGASLAPATPVTCVMDDVGASDVTWLGPAGQAYTTAPADGAGVTDAAARAVAVARAAADGAGVTSAVGVRQVLARGPADTAGATDLASAGRAVARPVSNTAGVTDATGTVQAAARTPGDTAGVGDGATTTRMVARTAADHATVGDAATAELGAARTVGDHAGAGDTADARQATARLPSDHTAATDAAGAVAALARAGTDTAPLTDQINVLVDRGQHAADTASVTDQVAAVVTADVTRPATGLDAGTVLPAYRVGRAGGYQTSTALPDLSASSVCA